MKSPIILQNRGFLTMEIILAISLLTLFTISTFTLSSTAYSMRNFSIKNLENLKEKTGKADMMIESDFAETFDATLSWLGNDTEIFTLEPFTLAKSDYQNAFGRNNCDPRIIFEDDEFNSIEVNTVGIDIGTGNASTDLEARNGIVYLTADSSSASKNDFFIIDVENSEMISSLNTGPGISAIESAGSHIFLAQLSTINQLQIIDIKNRDNPILITQFKLPLPTPTTTAPFAESIFYSDGYIYLGTEKWNGEEFWIINVTDVFSPYVVGSFETNTLVNDIYVRDDIAYLATADQKQMRLLDISEKTDPQLLDHFSPSGYQTQEGKILEYFGGKFGLGRTVGGFNLINNHEVFIFATGTDISEYISKDVPGGVYGMLMRDHHVFLLTHLPQKEFQIWSSDLEDKIGEIDLGSSPTKMSCDLSNIYFATGDGLSVIRLKNE